MYGCAAWWNHASVGTKNQIIAFVKRAARLLAGVYASSNGEVAMHLLALKHPQLIAARAVEKTLARILRILCNDNSDNESEKQQSPLLQRIKVDPVATYFGDGGAAGAASKKARRDAFNKVRCTEKHKESKKQPRKPPTTKSAPPKAAKTAATTKQPATKKKAMMSSKAAAAAKVAAAKQGKPA